VGGLGASQQQMDALSPDGPVCPGMRLGDAETCAAGRGTYILEGGIYASVVGRKRALPAADGEQKATIEVEQRSGGHSIQPQIGDTVSAKVTKVNPRMATCLIVCVNGSALEQNFPGVIRAQDVRATETDTVEIYNCFMPGDIVRAQVLSLGDMNSYYLTTAKNELGVISATCASSGGKMVPVSWQEMQCPLSLSKELRKVARIE
jgi:exosome complex component CSL4